MQETCVDFRRPFVGLKEPFLAEEGLVLAWEGPVLDLEVLCLTERNVYRVERSDFGGPMLA